MRRTPVNSFVNTNNATASTINDDNMAQQPPIYENVLQPMAQEDGATYENLPLQAQQRSANSSPSSIDRGRMGAFRRRAQTAPSHYASADNINPGIVTSNAGRDFYQTAQTAPSHYASADDINLVGTAAPGNNVGGDFYQAAQAVPSHYASADDINPGIVTSNAGRDFYQRAQAGTSHYASADNINPNVTTVDDDIYASVVKKPGDGRLHQVASDPNAVGDDIYATVV
ncbi:hypothetical protein N9A04_00840, partial [Rickettsiales bacterium]|nr:hypothetical protein [Rickettsiales bacterium]